MWLLHQDRFAETRLVFAVNKIVKTVYYLIADTSRPPHPTWTQDNKEKKNIPANCKGCIISCNKLLVS